MRSLICLLSLILLIHAALAQPVITYVSEDVPIAIPDGPNGIAESHLTIPDYYQILDVNVIVSIQHTYVQDLRLYLEAPNEDVVRLAYECGHAGDNYTETSFDDEAASVICANEAPFTGSFRPDDPLELLDGRRTNGLWTLRVTDNWHSDTGAIIAWRLEITIDTTVAAHEPPVVATFSVLQNYPNPFNAITVLPIELGHPEIVKLTVYNIEGRSVQQSLFGLTAGHHDLKIDGANWSSGSYFARVEAGRHSQVMRMLLLK